MKKKLYIDIDGVIGDLVAAVISFQPTANLINPYTYSLSKMFSNVGDDIILEPELYNSMNFRLYPFVAEVLRRCEGLGFEIGFISARPISTHSQSVVTLHQLGLYEPFEFHNSVYPAVDKISIIKDDILLNNIDRAWVIEDNPTFIIEMAGFYKRYPLFKDILRTLVYLQPYNQAEQNLVAYLEPFTPVMNWQHIYSEVQK